PQNRKRKYIETPIDFTEEPIESSQPETLWESLELLIDWQNQLPAVNPLYQLLRLKLYMLTQLNKKITPDLFPALLNWAVSKGIVVVDAVTWLLTQQLTPIDPQFRIAALQWAQDYPDRQVYPWLVARLNATLPPVINMPMHTQTVPNAILW